MEYSKTKGIWNWVQTMTDVVWAPGMFCFFFNYLGTILATTTTMDYNKGKWGLNDDRYRWGPQVCFIYLFYN
jgi:hypothetical protein